MVESQAQNEPDFQRERLTIVAVVERQWATNTNRSCITQVHTCATTTAATTATIASITISTSAASATAIIASTRVVRPSTRL